MQNILQKSTTSASPPQTTLTLLQTCTDSNKAFNQLAKLEQNLSIAKSIEQSPIICQEATKIDTIREIIRVVEFFLKVIGREMENFQIQILAGDLYERFQTDTLDDIILMFKMARQGEFGKVYTLDVLQINLWAEKYLDKKSAEREKIWSKQKHHQTPENSMGETKTFDQLPQELQDKFNNIGKNKPANVQEFLKAKATEVMTAEKLKREIGRLLEDD